MADREINRWFDPRTIEIVREAFGNKEARFNPRTLANQGFTPERMERLRKGIQRDGLNHPLLVRLEGGKPCLVAGERRLRVILQLIEEDVLCRNLFTGKMEPAKDVYCKYGVECKVTECEDEKDALRQAIQENTLHEGLSDFELLVQCDKMERANISRSEQAETMGMSEAWISQSHSLLAAKPKILKYMQEGRLQRTAALTFLSIPEEKVDEVLQRASEITCEEAEKKEKEAKKQSEDALDELQTAKEALRLSVYTGDHSEAKKMRRQAARATRQKAVADKKLKEVDGKKKKIGADAITKAAQEVDANDNLTRPQPMKQVRLFSEELGVLLGTEEKVLLNPETKMEYDRRDVEIVHNLLLWQLNKNKDMKHPLDAIPADQPKKASKRK